MGRARTFTTRRDIDEVFPQLDPECALPLARFDNLGLLADYWLPKAEQVHCQLVDAEGKCNEPHQWGWLVEVKDSGAVGFLGHDCADRHFRNDPRFAAMFADAVARVKRDIAINTLIKRLDERLSDPTLRPTLDGASRRWDALYERLNQVRGLLRSEILRRLMERIKRGNMDVHVRVLYLEKEIDEKTRREREIVRPQEVRLGVLTGVESLNMGPLNRIGGKFSAARAVLGQAVASEDQPDKGMKKWAAALEAVQPAVGDLYRIEAALARFLHPDNLQLIWLLEKDTFAQIAAVRVALELASSRRISDEEAMATHRAWVRAIRDAHMGFAFEVIV